MTKKWLALSLAVGTALGLAGNVQAAGDGSVDLGPASILPGGDQSSQLLGVPFENPSAGISFRIPSGCHRVRSTGGGDDIGQFADEKRNWQLKVSRLLTKNPMSLATAPDNFGKPIPGLLDQTVAGLKRDLAGCVVLRQDLTNVQDGDPNVKDNVAMIAVRYSAAGGRYLTQQAIVQSKQRLFYLLALTTPVGDSQDDTKPDPRERVAVETFSQLLDSIRLLDTAKIKEDQDDRLVRTRALMVNWSPSRLHAALVDEQWLRMVRDGKDVGYSYVTEQTAARVPRPLRLDEVKAGKSDRDLVEPGDGILIGVRARSVDPLLRLQADKPSGPIQVDSASWLFVTADRKLEDWSRIIVVDDGTVDKDKKPIKSQTEEFGTSSRQTIRSLDKEGMPGTKLDPHQPPISVRDQYMLDVTTVSGSGTGDPVNQQLSPWYLPQALGHLLPRLLPLRPEMQADGSPKPRSYLFAIYVPEVRAVIHRYVDVGSEQDVTFNGKTVRAVPIEDRIGWQGAITTHYMSPQGVYLGSEEKQTHLLILPTDAPTLLAIWKNADLSRPGGMERPRGGPGASVTSPPSASFIGPTVQPK